MSDGSHLERLLASGHFAVTAEVVPPKTANPADVTRQAQMLVGNVDAVNITNNPTSSAHMSAEAGAALVTLAGLEPTLQAQVRDRNRLALTSELLGGWAVGARNLLCLSGDPVKVGDHPDAAAVNDIDVQTLIGLASSLRNEGRLLSGATIEDAPRFFIGAADAPLAPNYDAGRLEAKIDAGAHFVQTQITYDLDAIGEWADTIRERGIMERAFVMPGVAPLTSAKSARFMHDHIPGVVVPDTLVAELEAAGPEAEAVGVAQCVKVVEALREMDGVAGVHVMGLGHEEAVLAVIDGAGLLPRPTPVP
ncbi:MAG: methylenetetrahydrofolate reductase [Actinomycetota bacterium]